MQIRFQIIWKHNLGKIRLLLPGESPKLIIQLKLEKERWGTVDGESPKPLRLRRYPNTLQSLISFSIIGKYGIHFLSSTKPTCDGCESIWLVIDSWKYAMIVNRWLRTYLDMIVEKDFMEEEYFTAYFTNCLLQIINKFHR